MEKKILQTVYLQTSRKLYLPHGPRSYSISGKHVILCKAEKTVFNKKKTKYLFLSPPHLLFIT